MKTVHERENIRCSQSFFDEDGQAMQFKPGYPKAKLYLGEELVSTLNPEEDEPGIYSAAVSIPEFGFKEITPLNLKWRAFTVDGKLVKSKDVILVQPSAAPDVGDVVLLEDERLVEFNLPVVISDSSKVKLTIYMNNEKVGETITITADRREVNATYTKLSFEAQLEPVLAPYLMVVDYVTFDNKKARLMLNLWVVTPQILVALNMLEGTLNKAKIDNVIPQLEYTQSDLLTYMQRGLGLFNMYQPNLTSFNGRNMQGGLLDMMVLCASYFALGAQLLAEGMLAFDFTGQAVTLNVDRTPAIESALGRVEQMMQERIPHIKQLLIRRGVNGGEGSDTVGNSSGLGHTVLSNSPTTSRHVWRPGFQNYYR